MIFNLPVIPDVFHYSFTAELEAVLYFFELKFNDRSKLWTLNIYDSAKDPILLGARVQTDVDLISRFQDTRLPPGLIMSNDTEEKGRDPEFSSFGREIKLFYFDEAELA